MYGEIFIVILISVLLKLKYKNEEATKTIINFSSPFIVNLKRMIFGKAPVNYYSKEINEFHYDYFDRQAIYKNFIFQELLRYIPRNRTVYVCEWYDYKRNKSILIIGCKKNAINCRGTHRYFSSIAISNIIDSSNFRITINVSHRMSPFSFKLYGGDWNAKIINIENDSHESTHYKIFLRLKEYESCDYYPRRNRTICVVGDVSGCYTEEEKDKQISPTKFISKRVDEIYNRNITMAEQIIDDVCSFPKVIRKLTMSYIALPTSP